MTLVLSFIFFVGTISADEWSGTEYAKNSTVQLSHAQRLLSGLSLAGNETILDLGCGDGKITVMLAEKVPQGKVIGLDPSESMLEKAEFTRSDAKCENLRFEKGAAETFELPETFDHIVAIHVMHWVKEQQTALENIYAHLKPHGQVHFIIAPSKEGLPFYAALQKTIDHWQVHFVDFVNPQQIFDMETYRKLMVKAGFHVEAIHYLYHESVHENKESLKAWIRQWQPHMKFLPNEKQSIFLDELVDNYLIEKGCSPDTINPVSWGEYVLIVEGMKMSTIE